MPSEPSGSTARQTAQRRKSSTNLDKAKGITIKSDAKPSRSQGESSAKRKEQNRIAQRAFRKRQKAHLEELEAEVIEKGSRIREITENNGLLLETMKQLQNQNIELKTSHAPNMPGPSMPYLQATGTPLTPDYTAGRTLQGKSSHAEMSTNSHSEKSWSSSTDSHDSVMSSPEGGSPHTVQEIPLRNHQHTTSTTGLQLNVKPIAMSMMNPPTQGSSGAYSAYHSAPTTAPNGVSPMPGQFHDPQHWVPSGASQTVFQGPYIGSNQNNNTSMHRMGPQAPYASQTHANPGPMARRYSDAITRHHARSSSDLQPLTSTSAHRPHTSISISRSANTKHPGHHHSMSVPNTAIPLAQESPQIIYGQAFPSPSVEPGFSGEPLLWHAMQGPPAQPQHIAYQQPSQAYSSSSSSNLGWSFSPISQSASFSSLEPPGDLSRSSASYFSALSIQPGTQSVLPQDPNHLVQPTSAIMNSGSVLDTWADMMPSMGVTTPLQELSSTENPLNVAGSAPLTIDQPGQSVAQSDSPFLPETGVFSMSGLDLQSEFGFPPFSSAQIFQSPSE